MKHKSIYYYANMAGQFSQVIPIYNKIGGFFITSNPFFETWILMNLKFGIGSTKFIYKKENIHKKVRGILISQTATNSFSKSDHYIRIYNGHGVSDKNYETPDKKLKNDAFDYFFLTGPKDLYRLETAIDNKSELYNKIIPIGMIRSDNIINKVYDRTFLQKKYKIDNSKITVLYAPTYERDGGTLNKFFKKIIEELGEDFNIIIRPHYYDKHLYKQHIRFIKGNKLKNVKYLYQFNLDITELFVISDILIGDRSSVDYDYIFTGKPIIRIENNFKNYVKPPPQFDINNYCLHYNSEKQDLKNLIKYAINNKELSDQISELKNNCFYFNDGNALNRACKKILELLESI